ncbi:MAG: AAA family ATPase [Thermodesulfovibrionales bacterium]
MKILELQIEDVRGIRKKIDIKPNGHNTVIHGPNGSGKSAVVDAIEFLFTGDISRLSGRGTRGISLKEHGPHIDAKPEDARVTAKVQIDGIDEHITLQRDMSKPKDLICSRAVDEKLKEILEIAARGQHVLSRSEILKYIAAEAGKRAEEIQAVLNLSMVEDLRKMLVTIKRDFDRTLQNDKVNYDKSMSSIKTALEIESFSEDNVLKKVNECRETLKGTALEKLEYEKLKEGIKPITQDDRVDPNLLMNTLSSAKGLIQEKGNEIYNTETELRQKVITLKQDEKLKKDLASKRLLDLGISLLEEADSCPLCLTEWATGRLKPFLIERQDKAKEAEKLEKDINKLRTQIDTEVTKLKGHIDEVVSKCEKLKLKDIEKDLNEWVQRLSQWSDALKEDFNSYPTEIITDDIKKFLAGMKWEEHCEKLIEAIKGIEKLTPEQQAWDTLTALKPVLERYFDEKNKYSDSELCAEKASVLSKVYAITKDKVLENLYNSVKDDFISYYKFLHGKDEDNFSAELKPEGSQLDLKVDFYGRGSHHPRALHSEGHQDSMGLCLYLALHKKIAEDKVRMIILDDVVMSIDSGHRRNICKLLNIFFRSSQFVITTHNRTWARQLNTDRVVTKKNLIEFKGWNVDIGPRYESDTDVWGKINKKLEDSDVTSAAGDLREHSEFFYEAVCDSLQADVRYRSDGRWELGDYLKGAKEAYKKYLKLAKQSANSWGDTKKVEEYTRMESEVNEIIERSQMEQWGINENVHYTKWKDFAKEDFLPIVEAFQDLEELFKCPQCQGMISLSMIGTVPVSVKCPRGEFNWNLEVKK